MSRFIQVLSTVFLVLVIAGCTGYANEPTPSPKPIIVQGESAPLPVALIANTIPPTATKEPGITSTVSPVPTMELDEDVLYHDDFRNPSSGWLEEKLEKSFTGYQGPEYYHVDVTSADFSTSVYVSNETVYEDVTIELKAFTETAAAGDYRYGIIFRRAKDSFYAFVISPNTRKWYVLKSSTNALEILREGTYDDEQGLGSEDTLRVDIKGGTFFLHVNNRLVGQKGDFSYTNGEVGLFVENLDSPGVSIYFNELTIREFQSPLIEANCTNGVDDDSDGLIDKADLDCPSPIQIPFITSTPELITSIVASATSCSPDPDNPPQCDASAPYDPRICDCGAFVPGGCTDPTASNYDPKAPYDDGSCEYDVLGCTDPVASNYNPDATIDDGSCKYDPTEPPPTDPPPSP
jgi:hypothetical protein